MTVRELIEKLEETDPDASVYLVDIERSPHFHGRVESVEFIPSGAFPSVYLANNPLKGWC